LSNQTDVRQGANAPPPIPAGRGVEPDHLSRQSLQVLIDQIATFNAFVLPNRNSISPVVTQNGGVIGIKCGEALHRFDLELETPSPSYLKAVNVLGEEVGSVNLRWMILPDSFSARPDTDPPPTHFDPSRSQRFAMQEMTFNFGNQREGFRSFGTGRIFPTSVDGRPRLIVAAVGTVIEGFGRFAGHDGTFTICGELTLDGGFTGHVVARILDEQKNLRTREELPPPSIEIERPDSEFTYLMWLAQKGKGPEQENRPSLTSDGQLRGLNIPMELKRGSVSFTTGEPVGFQSSELRVGEVIGLEVGFGRGSQPGASPEGTALSPFQFEGVARYRFDDNTRRAIGAITTNVLEGRRFDYRLAALPGEVAWRFGFFGPVMYGSGCFRGIQGSMFYGASNSIFKPPPGDHIITHCYYARVYDPERKFRAASRSHSR
jgi:hypothetical protein